MTNLLKGKVLPVLADLSSLHNLKAVWGNQLHLFHERILDAGSSVEIVNKFKADILKTFNMYINKFLHLYNVNLLALMLIYAGDPD